MLLERLINREDNKEMLENEQLSFIDYKAPTPEQLLQAGRKPTAEPIPFSEREPTYYKILNPSGKKLVNLIKEEINNPFNYAAGAGFLSKANKARTVAGIGHNKGPSLLQEDATGSVVKDDVARKIFTVDEEMDTLYDLRQRKKRVDDKYIYDDGALTNKQLELLEREGEKLSQTIKNLETKTINKIQKRFETNISSRTIPELDPKIIDRPSKEKISSIAIGEKNRDIIKNVDGFVDSPGFNSVYNSTYGGEKFSSQLHRIFKGSDKDIEDSDYLYNYTEMMTEGPITKVTKEGTESLNPLEIYERSISPPVTMQLGVNYGEPITKQTLFFVSPKKLANKLDKSDAGKDFFKLRKNEIDYLDNLEESIMTKGYKPNPIQISIYPSGNATIFEGNHRLYRALIRGDKEVPVTFQYLGGAERLDTSFGINELDTFVATGEKGYKKGKEITKYIKDVEKTYSSKSKLVNRLQFRKGGKAKSTVNKAGNYTKPGLRKRIFQRIKAAASHGTAAGKWSARKAQALAKAYKKAGGGYK